MRQEVRGRLREKSRFTQASGGAGPDRAQAQRNTAHIKTRPVSFPNAGSRVWNNEGPDTEERVLLHLNKEKLLG